MGGASLVKSMSATSGSGEDNAGASKVMVVARWEVMRRSWSKVGGDKGKEEKEG